MQPLHVNVTVYLFAKFRAFWNLEVSIVDCKLVCLWESERMVAMSLTAV